MNLDQERQPTSPEVQTPRSPEITRPEKEDLKSKIDKFTTGMRTEILGFKGDKNSAEKTIRNINPDERLTPEEVKKLASLEIAAQLAAKKTAKLYLETLLYQNTLREYNNNLAETRLPGAENQAELERQLAELAAEDVAAGNKPHS